jgi:high-affinity nickel-transport protein
VLLYGPWRRRVDKKRMQNTYFEPVLADAARATDCGETRGQDEQRCAKDGAKGADVKVKPVEATDAAGPSGT